MKRTISGMVGKGSINHNKRAFVAENVDHTRITDNIVYLDENIKAVYAELFGAALERYNAKQKRSDRKISDYYEHIRTGKQEKLSHEVIFQIGNVRDTAVGTPAGEQAKTVLDEFMRSFQERNPYLRVFSAHLHMDEATPHLHIDFVPFTTGSGRGLDTRVSMKKALAAQGFEGGSRGDTEFNQWINSEKKALALVMERHGIEWEQLGTHNEHLSVLDFKKQERQEEIRILEQSISKLQQKQVDIQVLENISSQRIPLSSKVMVEREEFEVLALAAKKHVAYVKNESNLIQRLEAAEKTITKLKATITALNNELKGFKSIKGRLNEATLQQESIALQKQNAAYQATLEQHGLIPLRNKHQSPRREEATIG